MPVVLDNISFKLSVLLPVTICTSVTHIISDELQSFSFRFLLQGVFFFFLAASSHMTSMTPSAPSLGFTRSHSMLLHLIIFFCIYSVTYCAHSHMSTYTVHIQFHNNTYLGSLYCIVLFHYKTILSNDAFKCRISLSLPFSTICPQAPW